MFKPKSYINYISLTNLIETFNYWLVVVVYVAVNIWNKLDELMVYSNLFVKFGFSSVHIS